MSSAMSLICLKQENRPNEYAEWLENKRNIKDRIEDLRDDLNAL